MLVPNAAVFSASVPVMLTLAFPLEFLGLEMKLAIGLLFCVYFSNVFIFLTLGNQGQFSFRLHWAVCSVVSVVWNANFE